MSTCRSPTSRFVMTTFTVVAIGGSGIQSLLTIQNNMSVKFGARRRALPSFCQSGRHRSSDFNRNHINQCQSCLPIALVVATSTALGSQYWLPHNSGLMSSPVPIAACVSDERAILLPAFLNTCFFQSILI